MNRGSCPGFNQGATLLQPGCHGTSTRVSPTSTRVSPNFNQSVTNFNQSVTNFKPAVAVLQPAVAVLQESECLCQVNHPTTYLTFLPQHQNPPGTNTPALWRRGPARSPKMNFAVVLNREVTKLNRTTPLNPVGRLVKFIN